MDERTLRVLVLAGGLGLLGGCNSGATNGGEDAGNASSPDSAAVAPDAGSADAGAPLDGPAVDAGNGSAGDSSSVGADGAAAEDSASTGADEAGGADATGAQDSPAGEAGDSGAPEGSVAPDGSACLSAPSGLLAWWRGEGNPNDALGKYNATPMGTVGFAAGKVGQAFSFSGAGFESAAFTYTGPMTIDAWAQATSTSEAQFTSILASGKPTDYDPFFQIEFNTTNQWALDVGNGADTINPAIGAVTTSFQHLAMTFDGSKGVVFYLNGQQTATASWTGAMPIAYEVFKIGSNRDDSSGANTHLFSGLVDEVHIFNRVLSGAEVAAIYGAGGAGLCP